VSWTAPPVASVSCTTTCAQEPPRVTPSRSLSRSFARPLSLSFSLALSLSRRTVALPRFLSLARSASPSLSHCLSPAQQEGVPPSRNTTCAQKPSRVTAPSTWHMSYAPQYSTHELHPPVLDTRGTRHLAASVRRSTTLELLAETGLIEIVSLLC